MNDSLAVEKQETDRKTYATPRLAEYGHVEKLTKGSTGLAGDGHTKKP